MNNDPYEAPNNPPPYVTREDDRSRNAGMPSASPNEQPLMVPKRFGFGYSFNWNNPRSVYLLLCSHRSTDTRDTDCCPVNCAAAAPLAVSPDSLGD